MTLTKENLIDSIYNQCGHSKNKSVEIIETVLETMKSNLAAGEDVMITGFGKFSLKNKGKRRGRNPATGEDMMLRPRRVVVFKSSGKLRDKVNGSLKRGKKWLQIRKPKT